ncbi:MAG TPA: hypothetical protein PKX12_06320 [Spirochaetota bacterium]|nr:hypothetical protein [Spirochaetota bacterium]
MKHSTLPSILYKYLTSFEDAKSFQNGETRFVNLSDYILTEDVTRKDVGEGYMDHNFDKNIDSELIKIESENNVSYPNNPREMIVCCFSSKLDDKLFDRFKCDYCIQVNNPKEYFNRINDKVNEMFTSKDVLAHNKVEYLDSPRQKGFINGFCPIYKNIQYCVEEEYRFFFHLKQNMRIDQPFITGKVFRADYLVYRIKFNIGSISDITTIIDRNICF